MSSVRSRCIAPNAEGLSRRNRQKKVGATALFCLILALFFAPLHAEARSHRFHPRPVSKSTHAKHSFLSVLGPDPKFASLVMDADTGTILHQDDPDKIVHPASLTKMMTLLVVFQALQDGRITLNDQVRVSAFAHSMAPSKLDLAVGSTIRLQDAIYAVVTHSANDMAVALGEHVGRTPGTFVSMMNQRAQSLGMSNSYFVNACGLPDPRQVTSARDMARLAHALIYYYPQYYHYFSTPSFTYAGHVYANHNHLMESYPGMDGIKTGYIVASGFNLVASAKRGNHRLIGVVFGGQSAKSRDILMQHLLDTAFAQLNTEASTRVPVPARRPDMPQGQAAQMASPQTTQQWTGQGDTEPAETRPQQVAMTALSSASLNPAGQPTQSASSPAAVIPAAGAMQLAANENAAASLLPGHDWAVQIGAYDSRVRTDQALSAAMATLPPELRHVTPIIAPLQTTQGWMFRGRLIGLTRAEAGQACKRIPNCLTVSPDAR